MSITMDLKAPVLGAPPELTAHELAELVGHAVPATAPEPQLTPSSAGAPVTAGAGFAEAVTTLYAEQSNRNSWLGFASSGWRQVSQASDGGAQAITMIGGLARSTGAAATVGLDDAGRIASIYLF